MCTISINPSSITAKPIGTTGTTNVSLSGTVANCASNDIEVTIVCAASTVSATAQLNGNIWTADLVSKCPCGTPLTITATCQDPVPCTDTYTAVPVCNCCPQVNTVANQGLWNSSGQNLVTFVTTLTFPAGCSVTVQRDFGDGNFGAQKTFTSSPASYQETHPYNPPAVYTSKLNILSNPSCGTSSGGQTGQISVSSAPPCATQPWLASLCRTLQFLFVLSGAVAGLLFIASFSPVCSGVNPALTPIATGFAIAAGATLILLYLICRRCVCGFFEKLFGQLFLATGAALLMFVLPTTLPLLINCTQPIPFAAPFVAFGAAVVAMLFGAAALLGGGWYQQYKAVCPLNICDYWQAIRYALMVAVVAVLIVFVTLAGALPFWPHTVIAVGGILILMLLSSLEIVINQNAGNC